MPTFSMGKVRHTPRGVYAADAVYEHLDTVQINSATWECRIPAGEIISGVDPRTDTTGKWHLLLDQGDPSEFHVTATGSATPRSLAARFSDVANVLDFGAVPGEDCTAAIQAAVDASLSVVFPASADPYLCGPITLRSGGRYTGDGVLERIADSGATVLHVPLDAENVLIDGLSIVHAVSDWNNACIEVGAYNESGRVATGVTIRNCHLTGSIVLRNIAESCIRDNTLRNGSIVNHDFCDELTIQGNTITHDDTYVGYNGINSTVSQDYNAAPHGRITIVGNTIRVYRMGIEWRDFYNGDNVEVRSLISQNRIEALGSGNDSSFGISLNASGWTVSDNVITRRDASHNGYGIEVIQNSNIIVSGNRIYDYYNGICVYSVMEDQPASNIVVANNYVGNCIWSVAVYRWARDVVVASNVIEFGGVDTDAFGIMVEGDSATAWTDGTYGRICRNVTVTGNIVRLDAGADTGFYSVINLRNAHNVTCADNKVTLDNDNLYTAGIRVYMVDNGIIRGNHVTSRQQGRCVGIQVAEYCGRNLAIHDNRFSGLDRGLDEQSALPNYLIMVRDNLSESCNTEDVSFPSAYATQAGGAKVAYSYYVPGKGTWRAGDWVFNRGANPSWKCTTSGTAGTLSGVTVTVSAGGTWVTASTLNHLEEGQYLTIAGISGIKRIASLDREVGTFTLDSAADATVTDAAAAFSPPVFTELPF